VKTTHGTCRRFAKVLPTLSNPAVLELEDETDVNSQVLAVSLRAVVLRACESITEGGSVFM